MLRPLTVLQAKDQTLPGDPLRGGRQEVLHHGRRADSLHRPPAAGGVPPNQQGHPPSVPQTPLRLCSAVTPFTAPDLCPVNPFILPRPQKHVCQSLDFIDSISKADKEQTVFRGTAVQSVACVITLSGF